MLDLVLMKRKEYTIIKNKTSNDDVEDLGNFKFHCLLLIPEFSFFLYIFSKNLLMKSSYIL